MLVIQQSHWHTPAETLENLFPVTEAFEAIYRYIPGEAFHYSCLCTVPAPAGERTRTANCTTLGYGGAEERRSGSSTLTN